MKKKSWICTKYLVGNGDPEHSLCRQVALIAERQNNIFDELKEAKERRKSTPQAIINWTSLVIGFIMMIIGYFSLHSGQKDIQATQGIIKAETKVTKDLLTPDTTEATFLFVVMFIFLSLKQIVQILSMLIRWIICIINI